MPANVTAVVQEISDRFRQEAIVRGHVSAFDRIDAWKQRFYAGAPLVEGLEAIKGFWQQAVAD